MSDHIRSLDHAPRQLPADIRAAAIRKAWSRCSRTACASPLAGITTIEEVLRVTRED